MFWLSASIIAILALYYYQFLKVQSGEFVIIPNSLLESAKGNSSQLILCIVGHCFDVSEGKNFYGNDGGYHFFSGKDATRAFATGDFTTNGLIESTSELKPEECKSIHGWLDFYKKSMKYHFIGYKENSIYINSNFNSNSNSNSNNNSNSDQETESQTDMNKVKVATAAGVINRDKYKDKDHFSSVYYDFLECASIGEKLATIAEELKICNHSIQLDAAPNSNGNGNGGNTVTIWCSSQDYVPRKVFTVKGGSTDSSSSSSSSSRKMQTEEKCMCLPYEEAKVRSDLKLFPDCSIDSSKCSFSLQQ